MRTGNRDVAPPKSTNAGASERLNRLLSDAGYPEGRGRLSRFCEQFNVGKTTAAAWLKHDVLPRDPADQQRIAKALGSSGTYWATGEAEGPELGQVDFLLVGKCVNALVVYLRDECELDPDSLPDEVLADAYGKLYHHAQDNGGDIAPELVARVAVKVLGKLAQKP